MLGVSTAYEIVGLVSALVLHEIGGAGEEFADGLLLSRCGRDRESRPPTHGVVGSV